MGQVTIPENFRVRRCGRPTSWRVERCRQDSRLEYTADRTVRAAPRRPCLAKPLRHPSLRPARCSLSPSRLLTRLAPSGLSAATRALSEGLGRRPGAPRRPRGGRLRPVSARAPRAGAGRLRPPLLPGVRGALLGGGRRALPVSRVRRRLLATRRGALPPAAQPPPAGARGGGCGARARWPGVGGCAAAVVPRRRRPAVCRLPHGRGARTAGVGAPLEEGAARQGVRGRRLCTPPSPSRPESHSPVGALSLQIPLPVFPILFQRAPYTFSPFGQHPVPTAPTPGLCPIPHPWKASVALSLIPAFRLWTVCPLPPAVRVLLPAACPCLVRRRLTAPPLGMTSPCGSLHPPRRSPHQKSLSSR